MQVIVIMGNRRIFVYVTMDYSFNILPNLFLSLFDCLITLTLQLFYNKLEIRTPIDDFFFYIFFLAEYYYDK